MPVTVLATLEAASPLCQSRNYEMEVPRDKEKETSADYEKRSWKNRAHVDADGEVFIPGMAFKNCVAEAAKYLKMQIPGEGKATYTKHFEAGILVPSNVKIGVKGSDIKGLWLFLPADGKRGSGKRVWKCIPEFQTWKATVEFVILDEKITKPVFERVLEEAGRFIGIGAFRPRNNGINGRFKVVSLKWE